MMAPVLYMTITFILCLAAVFCRATTGFNAGTCHVSMTCDGGIDGCVQTEYKFPRLAQVEDYIRVKTPIKQMAEVTICSWITPTFSDAGKTSFVSYANEGAHNAFLLYFANSRRFEVYINGPHQGVDLVITERTHLCTVVATDQGWAKVYTNGSFLARLSYSSKMEIQGGGILIIGQEQDSPGADFDPTQAFSGTVENFMMWYRLLNASEISTLADERCSCPRDYVIALRPEEIQIQGSASGFPVDEC